MGIIPEESTAHSSIDRPHDRGRLCDHHEILREPETWFDTGLKINIPEPPEPKQKTIISYYCE
jgi:hypothetical protein